MSIIRVRRIAGVMQLLGLLCVIAIFVHAIGTHMLPKLPAHFSPTPQRVGLGFLLFVAWMQSVVLGGVSMLDDRRYSKWIDIIGLLAFVGFFDSWFGSLELFLDKVHGLDSTLLAYFFNIVPIVQSLALAVLNPFFGPPGQVRHS